MFAATACELAPVGLPGVDPVDAPTSAGARHERGHAGTNGSCGAEYNRRRPAVQPLRPMPLLRAPLIALKWLAVTLGVLAWLVVAPLMEIVRGLRRAFRRGSTVDE
jgi:hypothetical protein